MSLRSLQVIFAETKNTLCESQFDLLEYIGGWGDGRFVSNPFTNPIFILKIFFEFLKISSLSSPFLHLFYV